MKPRLALMLAATLFGTTFAIVKDAAVDTDAMAFLALRFGFATLVLIPFALRSQRTVGWQRDATIAGLVLWAGYVTQTLGLIYTSTTISALLTYMLIVFVPLLDWWFFKVKPPSSVALGVGFCLAGLILLSGVGADSWQLGRGELLTLACAFFFALHVIVVGRMCHIHDALLTNAVQLGVVAVGCALWIPFAPAPLYSSSSVVGALVSGLFASVIAFTLQVWAQKTVPATSTAILLTLEPVTASVIGFFLGERLGLPGWVGAALILLAVLVIQLRPEPITTNSGGGA